MEASNVKAMREALLRCEAISHLQEIREWQCVKDMRSIIAHALSAPPRNCDVGTAEEQAEKFLLDRCDKLPNCGPWDECCIRCYAKWAQMPYEAEQGGNA